MAKNKSNKKCARDLRITSARNVNVGFLMVQNSQIEKAYRRLIDKTVEAIRDADSRQH